MEGTLPIINHSITPIKPETPQQKVHICFSNSLDTTSQSTKHQTNRTISSLTAYPPPSSIARIPIRTAKPQRNPIHQFPLFSWRRRRKSGTKTIHLILSPCIPLFEGSSDTFFSPPFFLPFFLYRIQNSL